MTATATVPTEDSTTPRQANAIDLHVGGRVRMRRKVLGISQDKLAKTLGLTFQQVQKYERGTNRISASKLYEIASLLEMPVNYFFEGLGDPAAMKGPSSTASDGERSIHHFLMTSEGLELAREFPKIRRGPLRRRVLELVRTMANEDAEAAEAVEAD